MMEDDMGLYGDPEIEGLVQVGQVDFSSGNCEFDYTTVWKRDDPDTGITEYFYASDAGCSCPEPYEDIHSINELTPLTSLNDFQTFLGKRNKTTMYNGDHWMDCVALIEKLHGEGVR